MSLMAEAEAIGIQYPHDQGYWDNESKSYKGTQIEDIELAHDMALAMDPYMEGVVWASNLHQGLSEQEPHAAYRRAGKKAEIFKQLVETQREEDDRKRQGELGYEPAPTLEEYIIRENIEYMRSKGLPWTFYRRKDQQNRVTNGFVDTFVMKAEARSRALAKNAGRLVFFKQRTRENIAVYEKHLSKKDQEIFAKTESDRPLRMKRSFSFESDEEATELEERSEELRHIFFKKQTVMMIAKTFGRKTLRGFSREDMEKLAVIIRENGSDIEPEYT